MLDEDDIPQETPESPVVNSPDKTPGASQLERNTEMSRAQTTATASVVRNLRSPLFVTCFSSDFQEKSP